MKRKPKGFTWPDPPTPLQAKLGFQILWWYFTKKEAVGQKSDSYAQVNYPVISIKPEEILYWVQNVILHERHLSLEHTNEE